MSISVCDLVGLLAITDKRVFVVVVGGGGGGFFVVVVVAFFQCNINPLRHCDLSTTEIESTVSVFVLYPS